jgi:hypothetical protein
MPRAARSFKPRRVRGFFVLDCVMYLRRGGQALQAFSENLAIAQSCFIVLQ